MALLEKKFLDGLSLLTEENIKLVEEIVLSQEDQRGINSTLAEIARELSIDRRSLSRVIDQDLDLHTLRKRKLQKLTDSNIEKFTVIHPRSYCQSILRKRY